MRTAFIFTTTFMTLLSGCDLFGSSATCSTDDECDGRDRCEAGECVTPRPDREGEGEGGEGEGEGEGEGGEGEGEGEGENPISDVITVSMSAVREPVTCAGATGHAALAITADATLPAAIVVELGLPEGVTTREPTTLTLLPGDTVTVLLDVRLGFVVGEERLPVEIDVAGAGTVVAALDVELFADSRSDVVEGEAPPLNDVLLVIENSGSMTSTVDGTGLRNDVTGAGGFVDDLFARGGPGLRVAVIDAAPVGDTGHGVARACTATGSGPVLTTADAVRCVVSGLWNGFNGSGVEESLAPIVAWFGPARDAANGSMLRSGARFTAISIGDSDDQGITSTSTIIGSLRGLVPSRSSDVTVHALRAGVEGCSTSPANTNVRMDAVVDATDGLTGDVCNAASRSVFFEGVLADLASASSSLTVEDLPAAGEVVACVDNDDVCVVVPDALERAGGDVVTVTSTLPEGTLQVLTAPSCSL